MEVQDFDFSVEHGFVWITVDGELGDQLSISCCLEADADNKYVKKIKKSECGHNWGNAGEGNEKAFALYGEKRCMKLLFAEAKRHGFEVIG